MFVLRAIKYGQIRFVFYLSVLSDSIQLLHAFYLQWLKKKHDNLNKIYTEKTTVRNDLRISCLRTI